MRGRERERAGGTERERERKRDNRERERERVRELNQHIHNRLLVSSGSILQLNLPIVAYNDNHVHVHNIDN